jgi:hypothetical protein
MPTSRELKSNVFIFDRMFSVKKCVWSVYKIAGEVYGSKLVGHYCSPESAYIVALSKQLDKRDEEFKAFIENKKCIREELHTLQYEAINSKNFLNKTIYHVKVTEYANGITISKCSICPSNPPNCLR